MKRDISTIIVGILFLIAGIAIGGSMLGLFEFTLNFDGWWTIFIIGPALIAIAQGGINAGNIVVLGVGVVLLLNAQGIIPPGFTWKIIFPIALLAIGFQLLFGDSLNRSYKHRGRHWRHENGTERSKTNDNAKEKKECGGIFTESSKSGISYKTASAFFAGQDICYGPEDFTGGSYTAVFAGLTINLCNITFTGDIVIQVSAIFGGIELILPSNVQVVTNVVPILGGTDIKYPSSNDPAAQKNYY